MKLTAANTMTLCIDFQEKIVPVMSHPEMLVARTSLLLRGLAVFEIPLVVTRQYPKGLGDTIPELRDISANARTIDKITFSAPDTPEIREALALPVGTEMDVRTEVGKTGTGTTGTGTTGTGEAGTGEAGTGTTEVGGTKSSRTPESSPHRETGSAAVFSAPVERPWILVCGIETHICVAQTVLDLLESGRKVGLVTDCVDSRDPTEKERAIQRMIQAGAVPMSSESVLFELTGRAGTETFRQISRLVTGR